jgi:hypothetical protein
VVSVNFGRSLPTGERTLVTQWIGGWVGLRAGVKIEVRGEILYLCR